MRCLPQLIVLVISATAVSAAQGQLIFGQIRQDYRQPMSYSPDDPMVRSNVFRAHTGHSGRFYDCDGEEEKRYSPYIRWETVCNSEHIRPWGEVIRCDIKEVKRRVQSGACRGDKTCNCSACREFHGMFLGSLDGKHASPGSEYTTSTPVVEPSHVVYGSRASRQASRQASAEQRLNAKESSAVDPTRTAERPDLEGGVQLRRR